MRRGGRGGSCSSATDSQVGWSIIQDPMTGPCRRRIMRLPAVVSFIQEIHSPGLDNLFQLDSMQSNHFWQLMSLPDFYHSIMPVRLGRIYVGMLERFWSNSLPIDCVCPADDVPRHYGCITPAELTRAPRNHHKNPHVCLPSIENNLITSYRWCCNWT